MKFTGLTEGQVEESCLKHGTNALTDILLESLGRKFLKGFMNPLIMILLVALAIQLVLFFFDKAAGYEPFGILAAIIIANGVVAFFENKQEGKASALKHEASSKEKAKEVRGNILTEISFAEIVVGDIIYLQAGDKIPADGIVLDGTIKVDNLSSIEKAILYGRTMFKSIRNFLAFQLTVNVAAVLTCSIAPIFGYNAVLTVIQLFLINLVMDTLAAIA